ncbi:MAG TPA: BLUF domain-containing protein, partial [Acetobacteraceae bacterium]|nr:BLUF domain-containing protein [Acetobacteraceae bacterium]
AAMWFSSSAPPDLGTRQTNSSAALSTVVYRSRAVLPLSGQDLQGLMQAAQARNRREAITGVMLYDDSRFYQWLEGPAEGVGRVMHSIHGDPRHTDLEILSDVPASERRFGDWDMRLATRDMGRALWRSDVIEPSSDIIDSLRRHPKRAAGLLLRLLDRPDGSAHAPAAPDRSRARAPVARATASVLRTTFLELVVPELLHRHGTGVQPRSARLSSRAVDLAELLISSDEEASLQLIRELRGDGNVLDDLYTSLFEPAARKLGDLWTDDVCSEFDVALGLTRLQTAVRLLGMDVHPLLRRGLRPNVLVTPAPGEPHGLVASLDSEWLWSRGWAPQQDFPADDRALQDLLSDAWVDVLDLSLSAAFRREDKLSSLRQTIALARQASRNSALLVVVGGRAFAGDQGVVPNVGADLASRTSHSLDSRLLADLAAREDRAEIERKRAVST